MNSFRSCTFVVLLCVFVSLFSGCGSFFGLCVAHPASKGREPVYVYLENRSSEDVNVRFFIEEWGDYPDQIEAGADTEFGWSIRDCDGAERRIAFLLEDGVVVELELPPIGDPDLPYVLTVFGCDKPGDATGAAP